VVGDRQVVDRDGVGIRHVELPLELPVRRDEAVESGPQRLRTVLVG
jgi:hypothetical protein